MAAYDTIVRNAFIVDGTGGKAFTGSIGIKNGLVAEICSGDIAGVGSNEIDAKGHLVAPGWVDVHSHFDAQAFWDPLLTPSCAAGVTTIVGGNCGVGVAPCRPQNRKYLSMMMQGVEDIPMQSILEGLGPGGQAWDFVTFPEYLDALEKRQFAADFGVMISHGCVRTYVLDKERNMTLDRPGGCYSAPITEEELSNMVAIVREAVEAGALGFSCNRFANHRDALGGLVPGTLAMPSEMIALSRAVAEAGGGIIEVVSDFTCYDDIPFSKMDPEIRTLKHKSEWRWMMHVMKNFGLPISLGSGWGNDLQDPDPTKHVGHFRMHDKLVSQGLTLKGQVMIRPQGFLQCFESNLNHFVQSETYRSLKNSLDPKAFRAALLQPANRETILSEMKAIYDSRKALWYVYDNKIWFRWTPGYEPTREESLYSEAKASGRHALDIAYDIMSEDSGRGVMWRPHQNYGSFDLEQTRNALMHDGCIPGTSDAGAHCNIMQDALGPTSLLTHFVRDRTRGPKIALEFAVKRQTHDTARLFGFTDRGTLEVGMRADLNIMDMDKLEILKPTFEYDMPAGASRWMQAAKGYDLTMVAGVATYRDGEPTGELPGRLVRNQKSAFAGKATNLSAVFVDELKTLLEAKAVEMGNIVVGEVSEEEALQRAMDGDSGSAGLTSISRMARLTEKEVKNSASSKL